jgi:large subunit ribosomal protein L10
MNRDQKAAVIEEIAADISQAQAIFAVDYRGITVAQAGELRRRLRAADATFRVVKNSLTERAADRAGADQLKALLEGPTALTFVQGDAAAAAKAVSDFARATQLLAFKGGLMDGAALTSAEVGAISRLPSRDVLYGQLVGLVANPIAGLARTLNALLGGLAVGLGGVLAKKESGEIPAGISPAEADSVDASEESEISAGFSTAEADSVDASEESEISAGISPAEADSVDASEDGDGAEAAAVEDASGVEVATPPEDEAPVAEADGTAEEGPGTGAAAPPAEEAPAAADAVVGDAPAAEADAVVGDAPAAEADAAVGEGPAAEADAAVEERPAAGADAVAEEVPAEGASGPGGDEVVDSGTHDGGDAAEAPAGAVAVEAPAEDVSPSGGDPLDALVGLRPEGGDDAADAAAEEETEEQSAPEASGDDDKED